MKMRKMSHRWYTILFARLVVVADSQPSLARLDVAFALLAGDRVGTINRRTIFPTGLFALDRIQTAAAYK